MLYFAYGSNMSSRRLRARVPSARFVTLATLTGHALRFHKKSVDGSAKCDACRTDVDIDAVIGVVFEIDASHKPELDRVEGVGMGYEITTVSLQTSDGERFDAFMYYATLTDASLKPYHWYKQHVLEGAQEYGLPGDYIERISRIESMDDPDSDRDARERAHYAYG